MKRIKTWFGKKLLGFAMRSAANEIKSAKDNHGRPKYPMLIKFFDLANEMSLTEALNAVGSEFDWPVSHGTAMARGRELCQRHLGEYGSLVWPAVKIFQKQFNRKGEVE